MKITAHYALAPLGGLALLLPAAALAQGSDTSEDRDGVAVVVTANRTPVRVDRIGQSVTVIDQGAIDASQAVGVTELLVQTPGVQFSRNGGPGKTTSIYIRGAETGQAVVLYDGVRLNDPSTPDAGASMADMVIGDIARIEILRGAQSALWGSQAIGGVINIITRKPEKSLEANGLLEAGGLDSYLAKAGLGGKQGGLSWRIGGSYFSTQGVSAYDPGTEADGYENVTLSGGLDIALGEGIALDLRSLYALGRNDTDAYNGDAPYRADSESWLNHAGLTFGLFERLQNRLSYARTDIVRTNYDDASARSAQPVTFAATGRTNRFEYQGQLTFSESYSAVFGLEYADNWMRTASPSPADPAPTPSTASDNTTGLYAQLVAELDAGLTLTGGLRHEAHSTFGGSTVGSAAVAWSLNGGDTVLRASWAQGFKAPSLYQLYSEYGNEGLAPESADSWDIGFEHRLFGVVSLAAVYFRRDTNDLVDFAFCPGVPAVPLCGDGRFGYYENLGKVSASGVELGASARSGRFFASANFTLLDARNRTPGDVNEGNRLARRARESYNASLSYTWPFGLETAAAFRIAGASFNDAGNARRLDPYAVVDLRMAYPIGDMIEIHARLENAFDARYATIGNYGTLPRLAYGGVRLRF